MLPLMSPHPGRQDYVSVRGKKVAFCATNFIIQSFPIEPFVECRRVGILAHRHKDLGIQIVEWMATTDEYGMVTFGWLRQHPNERGYYSEIWERGYMDESYWTQWKSTGVPFKVGRDCVAKLFSLPCE